MLRKRVVSENLQLVKGKHIYMENRKFLLIYQEKIVGSQCVISLNLIKACKSPLKPQNKMKLTSGLDLQKTLTYALLV